jgi:hypothetical protein
MEPNFNDGAATKLKPSDIDRIAYELAVEPAALQAVLDIEARSTGFNADGSPVILYEPHIAYARTTGDARKKLTNAGLAYSKWGQRPYPKTYRERYDQLKRAWDIVGDKAFEFASFGLPQMMGFNFRVCGYASARAMFEAFKQSEYEQLIAMARFISANSVMLSALRRKDWTTFARLYNGDGYAKNGYHTKLAAAYKKRAAGGAPKRLGPLADGILSMGDKGSEVVELQNDLNRLGFGPVTVDGDFGPVTRQAVMLAQKTMGLKVDGIAGEGETLPAIAERIKALSGTSLPGTTGKPPEGVPEPQETASRVPVEPVAERIEAGSDNSTLETQEILPEPKAPGFWERLWGAIKSLFGG